MSLAWGDYRTVIQRTILHDTAQTVWQDDLLLDCIGWALDAFCVHTAQPTSVVYDPAQQQNALPADIFASMEDTAALYLINTSRVYLVEPLQPLNYENTRDLSYAAYGNGFTLTQTPPDSSTLQLFYFAYYPHPVSDDDLITIPQWAYNAVAHLVGSYAHTSVAVQSAGIDRFKDKRTDSGSPEDNALRAQQKWMFQVYENELARFPNQNRENYYERLIVTS